MGTYPTRSRVFLTQIYECTGFLPTKLVMYRRRKSGRLRLSEQRDVTSSLGLIVVIVASPDHLFVVTHLHNSSNSTVPLFLFLLNLVCVRLTDFAQKLETLLVVSSFVLKCTRRQQKQSDSKSPDFDDKVFFSDSALHLEALARFIYFIQLS